MDLTTKPTVAFKPITPTHQDDFDVILNGVHVGTFYWNRLVCPSGPYKVATVRSRHGPAAIMPSEGPAVKWLVQKEMEADAIEDAANSKGPQ